MADATFDPWDYTIMILMILISISIGFYYRFTGGKQKTAQEYLMADKNMSALPVGFSLMASFMSAITLLGVSTENYMYGTQFVVINVAYGIATPIAAYLYLPVFFKLQKVSAYEYLGLRFGETLRLIASLVYTLQMILYIGIVLYAPALTLEAVTGFSKTISILIIGFVCTIYSTMGGMKAVLMTDVFQSLLMYAAVFSVIIFAAISAGGLDVIWNIAYERGRIEFNNFSFDPTVRHTWWSLVIGGMVTYLSLYAVNQTQVQRLLTVKDLKTSQRCLWLNWPILTLLSLTTSFSGLAIFSKYYNCDPVKTGKISSVDQLMPYYVMNTMGGVPGLAGLFIAGIFSASLSTVSAACNSLAAVTMHDYVKPMYERIKKQAYPENVLITKLVAFLYGLASLAVAFIAQNFGGLLQASLTIFGTVGGPLFGIFTLGMFTLKANEAGCIIGLFTGLSFSFWQGFGQPRPPPPYLETYTDGCNATTPLKSFHDTMPETLISAVFKNGTDSNDREYFYLYRLSYMWTGVLGFVMTMVVGYLASLVLLKYSRCKFGNRWDVIDVKLYKKSNSDDAAVDSAELYQNKPNPDLFTPPLAAKIRRQNAKEPPKKAKMEYVLLTQSTNN